MKEDLSAAGLSEGRGIVYSTYNAGNDPNKFSAVAQGAIAANVDLILAIATPTARAAVRENANRIPLVFSAVTDPLGAGIVNSLDAPGGNVTGVSDAWPYEAQLRLIRRICPDARRVGVIYNPAEENSAYGIKNVRALAPGLGFEIQERPVANEGEVASAAASLVGRVDVFFITSDNVAVAQAPTILKAAFDNGLPVFAGDSGTVQRGALAAASVGYEGVGRETARLIRRILSGEPAGRIPVVVATGDEIHLNLDAARKIKLTLSPALLAAATRIYGTDITSPSQRPANPLFYTIALVAGAAVIVILIISVRRRARQPGARNT
jgi:putative ABC transport system substrate-binding protein